MAYQGEWYPFFNISLSLSLSFHPVFWGFNSGHQAWVTSALTPWVTSSALFFLFCVLETETHVAHVAEGGFWHPHSNPPVFTLVLRLWMYITTPSFSQLLSMLSLVWVSSWYTHPNTSNRNSEFVTNVWSTWGSLDICEPGTSWAFF